MAVYTNARGRLTERADAVRTRYELCEDLAGHLVEHAQTLYHVQAWPSSPRSSTESMPGCAPQIGCLHLGGHLDRHPPRRAAGVAMPRAGGAAARRPRTAAGALNRPSAPDKRLAILRPCLCTPSLPCPPLLRWHCMHGQIQKTPAHLTGAVWFRPRMSDGTLGTTLPLFCFLASRRAPDDGSSPGLVP